jgi:MscS family membrane protein
LDELFRRFWWYGNCTELYMKVSVTGALLVCTFGLAAQPSNDEKPPPPKDPLSRATPQSAILGFLNSIRAKDLARAEKYLAPDTPKGLDRQAAASALGSFLNQAPNFDLSAINNRPEGDENDGLAPDKERVYSMANGSFVVELERRALDQAAPDAWMFTAVTAKNAPQNAATADVAAQKYLPTWLYESRALQTPLWRWAALFVSLLLATVLSGVLSRVLLRVARPICDRLDPGGSCDVPGKLLGPARFVLLILLFQAAIAWIPSSAIGRFYADRVLHMSMVVVAVWMASRLFDIGVARFQVSLARKHGSLTKSALPLLARIGKALLLVLAVTFTLTNWGFDMTTVLAGVGIGGIAIALAAQKTVENLFGGIAIITDGPVTVGDFCKFGDRVGTVEDIGLRSTRVRTLDRTLVTVPNSEFSGMVLENFSRRDKIWFHPTFNLRKDATAEQVQAIVKGTENILKSHPKTETGSLPVRFVGIGSYSLDIEIFAYILTADFDEFLRIQQELLFPIMRVISDAGTALALPTQASVFLNAPSNDHVPVNAGP